MGFLGSPGWVQQVSGMQKPENGTYWPKHGRRWPQRVCSPACPPRAFPASNPHCRRELLYFSMHKDPK